MFHVMSVPQKELLMRVHLHHHVSFIWNSTPLWKGNLYWFWHRFLCIAIVRVKIWVSHLTVVWIYTPVLCVKVVHMFWFNLDHACKKCTLIITKMCVLWYNSVKNALQFSLSCICFENTAFFWEKVVRNQWLYWDVNVMWNWH